MPISTEDLERLKRFAKNLTNLREEAEDLGLSEELVEAMITVEGMTEDAIDSWSDNSPEL
jgi:hypothetical protein